MLAEPVRLLPNGAPRSASDLKADIIRHPVTGTFTDPSHEAAFSAQLFRLAFPVHALLMALSLPIIIWLALSSLRDDIVVLAVCFALALIGRVLVHSMHDEVRGQRVGSWTWTVLVVTSCFADLYEYATEPSVCNQKDYSIVYPLVCLAVALTNGSHGMAFLHKYAIIGVILFVDCLVVNVVCGEPARTMVICEMAALFVGSVVSNMAELFLRRYYAEKVQERRDVTEEKGILEERLREEKRWLEKRNEQLQKSNERLMYDVQRRGRSLDDGDDDRSAVRRGLQGGPPASGTGSSEAGAPGSRRKPPDSPPVSIPPGPPSSTHGSNSEESMAEAAYQLVGLQSAAAGQASECNGSASLGHASASVGAPVEAGGCAKGADADVERAAGIDDCHERALCAAAPGSDFRAGLTPAAGLSPVDVSPDDVTSALVVDAVCDGDWAGCHSGGVAAQGAEAAEQAYAGHKRSRPATVAVDADPGGSILELLMAPVRQVWAAQQQQPCGHISSQGSYWPTSCNSQGSCWPTSYSSQGSCWPTSCSIQGSYWPTSCSSQGQFVQEAAVAAASHEPAGSFERTQALNGLAQSNMTKALMVARHHIQLANTDLEVQQVVRTLAAALGAARTELGTIKALHAVLIKLERPGLSDMQAYTSTNASKSNFNKWRSRVNFVLYEAEQARYAAALSSQPQP